MILTCPECATRYFVDDDRVGSSRTVRCAACGAAWRASSDHPIDLVDSPEEGAIGFARAPAEAPTFRSPESTLRHESIAPDLHKTFRARAEQKRRVRQAAAAGVVWGVMCAGFALVIGAAYLFRVDVVKLYPKAAGAYAWVGAPVNPTGLTFEKIAATPAPDGLAAVTVTGQVRNVAAHAAAPPPIRVALLDKTGTRIAIHVLNLPSAPLSPGRTLPFSVSLPDPTATAADVDVTFALDLVKPPAPPKPRMAVAKPASRVTPQVMPNAAPKAAPLFAQSKPAVPLAPPPQASPKMSPMPVSAKAPATSNTAGLRPAISVLTQKPVEAKPLPAGDPYALPSAPHG
jgi:predicted Zn finger-like uncharacterized protein